jgi:glycosyltransferase involved in cell wall biosynthesis
MMAQEKPHKIIFDCERMKYPNTGLYHFNLQLAKELIYQSSHSDMEISLFAAKQQQQKFEKGTNFIDQSAIHKFILPSLDGYGIWHATHQSTDYFPIKEDIKILMTIHDLNFLHEVERSGIKKKRAQEKLQRKIEKADKIVAISAFVADDLKRHFQFDLEKLQVIYNGCNIDETKTGKAPANQPKGEFLFTIGTVVEKKNFQVLPALLVGNHFKLIIAGQINSKSCYQKIISAATSLGVSDRVIFTGPISEAEKYWYYQNCKAFVFPSMMEGFGLPVVEAMAFGKPIFLSKQTSLPEIGGDAAFYFNNFDGPDMQSVLETGLKEYAADKNRRKKIIERASLFSWKLSARAYLEAYRQILIS